MLTGQNGILTQANKSKIEQSHGAVKEAISLAYNEWQIEVNTGSRTKLASTETVIINGEEEKAKAGTSETFLQFLERKGYIKENTTDVLDVEKLTGSKQALGNGEDTDIYKIELKDGNYEVNYYGENGETRNIWSIASKDDSQGSATLEPDTGKEALILVYKVQPGDTIELPYYNTYFDGENEHPANFDFTVDWGDGQTDTITTDNISEKATYTYANLDTEKEIKISITGTFESIAPYNESYEGRQGYDKLVKVEQWGTTGVKTIDLSSCSNLTKIAQPTESSFRNLLSVYFNGSGITSIPDKIFMNCVNLFEADFSNCPIKEINDYAFYGCENLEGIYSFEDNVYLNKIGDYAFYNCKKIEYMELKFYNCNNLTTIGDYAFANCSSVTSFESAFGNCYNLTTIGDYAFANCSSVTSFGEAFESCGNLTTIGKHIFEGCDNVESYICTFNGCFNLTGKAPELWLRVPNGEENDYIGIPDGKSCFGGCEKLDNYDDIPEYWSGILEE